MSHFTYKTECCTYYMYAINRITVKKKLLKFFEYEFETPSIYKYKNNLIFRLTIHQSDLQ